MCGIAGMFGERPDAERVMRMRESLAHRGPDGAGSFLHSHVALGHRRLSIIDLSDNGRQPMTTTDGRYTIVFNGEVYNYREIRTELGDERPWMSGSDTEVILRAYERWGRDAVSRMNGMFAFAIYDAHERRLFCVRDRLGIKPLYYHFDGTHLFFASEIKALLAAGIRAQPNHARIVDYVKEGLYDHTNETFFDGIVALPPGHLMELSAGHTPQPTPYWSLYERAESIEVPKTDEEVIVRFSALLQDAISLRLRSDVPVGVTLSSGLDSTGVLAHLRAVHPDASSLHAFTACYPDVRYDEGRLTEPVIRRFGNPWHQSFLDPTEVPMLADELLGYQDEPYGGIPQLGFFNLHRQAREQGVTVLLEGHGVEEYLTGYPMYFPPYWTDLAKRGAWGALRRELRGAQTTRGSTTAQLMRDWYAYLSHGRGLHLDLTRQSYGSMLSETYERRERRDYVFEQPFQDGLRRSLYTNLRYAKLPRVLRFQDRVSMASGRELRLPYLDYRLVEYVTALPASYKIRDGVDKWLLRASLASLVPQEVIAQKKSTVVTPQTPWLQNDLRAWVTSLVQSETFRSRSCFDHTAVARRLDTFFRDPRPRNSFFVWQLINVELWFRRFIDHPL